MTRIIKGGNMKDIKFIYKKQHFDDTPLGKLDRALTALYGRADETLGWKFSYKGQKYGYVIYGTRAKPITDKDVIRMLELAIQLMNKLRNKKGETWFTR